MTGWVLAKLGCKTEIIDKMIRYVSHFNIFRYMLHNATGIYILALVGLQGDTVQRFHMIMCHVRVSFFTWLQMLAKYQPFP